MLSLNNPIRASICISLRHKMQAFTGLKWSQSHTAIKLPRQSSWALQALSECLTGSWLHVIRCFLLNIFFVTFLFTLFMLQCDSDYVDVSFVFIREVPGPLASFCVGLSWLTDSHRLWPCGSGVYSWIFTLSPVHPDITFMVDWAFKFQYRFAPPASGETMQQLRQSVILSLIHRRTAGSAYRLSTGMSKKPCKENHSTSASLR